MKDLKKMISAGEQVIGGAIMYGAGKEDIEKLLDYYDYDFISVDGKGVIILKDADRSVTRTYNIASSNQTLSYKLPGPTLFRGNFNFSGNENIVQIRIPQDVSYSENTSKILIYLYDNEQEVSSEINPVFIVGGDATMDQSGPIIEFKSEDGKINRNADHIRQSETKIVKIYDP